MQGVSLLLTNPKIAQIDCTLCEVYQYDLEKGKPIRLYGGQLIRRVTRAPCRYGRDRCPKINPEAGSDLTRKNKLAYVHYLQCKAVGKFPDDPIVHRNAGIIRRVEDTIIMALQGIGLKLPKDDGR